MSHFFSDAAYVTKEVAKRLPSRFVKTIKNPETEIDKFCRATLIADVFLLAAAGIAVIAKPLAEKAAPSVKHTLQAHGYLLDKHPELEKRQREQQAVTPAPM